MSDPVPTPTPPDLHAEPLSTAHSALQITLVNAVAFSRACKLASSVSFTLDLTAKTISAYSTSISNSLLDLSGGASEEYHELTDIFSKTKADILLEHCPYNHKITIEGGTVPPLGPIYSLSKLELDTLQEYINENLRFGFIQPSVSLCGAPVLFAKKKDSLLWLCFNYLFGLCTQVEAPGTEYGLRTSGHGGGLSKVITMPWECSMVSLT